MGATSPKTYYWSSMPNEWLDKLHGNKIKYTPKYVPHSMSTWRATLVETINDVIPYRSDNLYQRYIARAPSGIIDLIKECWEWNDDKKALLFRKEDHVATVEVILDEDLEKKSKILIEDPEGQPVGAVQVLNLFADELSSYFPLKEYEHNFPTPS